MMTIQAALEQGTKILADAYVPVPRLTAEVLLAHATNHDRPWLYAHSNEELREVWWIHYGRYLNERIQGKPTQYITRKQEFYGREFVVSPDVLIPRPETEHVVEAALARVAEAEGAIIDAGTGSGAIGITIALETGRPVLATDISTAALRLASKNRGRLKARVDLAACDLVSAIGSRSAGLVVSNPPYVPETDKYSLQREVRDFEPPVALYGGADGFEAYRRLIADAARVLRPGGWLVLEVAYNASEDVRAMLAAAYTDIALKTDLAGLPRVMCGRFAG